MIPTPSCKWNLNRRDQQQICSAVNKTKSLTGIQPSREHIFPSKLIAMPPTLSATSNHSSKSKSWSITFHKRTKIILGCLTENPLLQSCCNRGGKIKSNLKWGQKHRSSDTNTQNPQLLPCPKPETECTVQLFPSSSITAPHSLRVALKDIILTHLQQPKVAVRTRPNQEECLRMSASSAMITQCMFPKNQYWILARKGMDHTGPSAMQNYSVFRLQFCTLSKFCLCPAALRMGLHKALEVQALHAQ